MKERGIAMYAVVKANNFDHADIEITICKTENEAKNFLKKNWQESYNIEIANSLASVLENRCYYEDDYAIITLDNGCKTWWTILHKKKKSNGLEHYSLPWI